MAADTAPEPSTVNIRGVLCRGLVDRIAQRWISMGDGRRRRGILAVG